MSICRSRPGVEAGALKIDRLKIVRLPNRPGQPTKPLQTGGRRSMSDARKHPSRTLQRVAFKTSRLAEFCSRRELVAQTGHQVRDWPLVILKELTDNAIDICEEKDIAPEIAVSVSAEEGTITIADNGPGDRAADRRRCAGLRGSGELARGLCLADPRGPRQCAQDPEGSGGPRVGGIGSAV